MLDLLNRHDEDAGETILNDQETLSVILSPYAGVGGQAAVRGRRGRGRAVASHGAEPQEGVRVGGEGPGGRADRVGAERAGDLRAAHGRAIHQDRQAGDITAQTK